MPERPNIVLIMCDEMRWNSAGFAGSSIVKTPNLDRLAAEGVCFENAYCASPVCSPARASWLTGLYPHAHHQLINYSPDRMGEFGCFLPEDKTTISEVLADAGYRCGIVGPWHLGDDHVPQRGYGEFWWTYRYQGAGRPDRLFDYFEKEGVRNLYRDHRDIYTDYGFSLRFATTGDNREQRTTWTVDRGIDFIEADGTSPFFLFLSVKDPHPHILVPEKLLGLYPEERMPLPEDWKDTLEGKPEFLKTEKGRMDPSVTAEQLRKTTAHYFALISHIDIELGRLFERLEEKNQLQNTVIAFISDHGEMLGDHGFTTKRVLFDGSVRVPCIISWADGLPKGLKIETPLPGVDLMPTLLELAGVDEPSPIDGRSVAGPIRSGRAPAAKPVLAEISSWQAIHGVSDDTDWMAAHVMIRVGKWKYNRNRFDTDELYDLESDPGEMTNLAGRPDMAGTIRNLRGRIAEAIVKTGPGPYAWCLEDV